MCLKYEWQIEIIILYLDAFKTSSEPNDHLRAFSWFLSVWDTFNVFISAQIKQASSKHFNFVSEK